MLWLKEAEGDGLGAAVCVSQHVASSAQLRAGVGEASALGVDAPVGDTLAASVREELADDVEDEDGKADPEESALGVAGCDAAGDAEGLDA